MAKEFKKWIDEFVENGANPKDVTNWPEEAGGGSTVVANPELSGDEPDLTGLQVGETKYKVPQGSDGIEYVELNSTSGTIEVETFQKLDFGGAYIKYNDIVLIPNGREQSGGGLGGTKTCYFDSTVNNNKYLSCVLTASLPLPPNATVPYTITEVSVGGGGSTNLYLHSISIIKTNGCYINFSFINSTSTPYNENGLFSLFRGSRIPCSGVVIDNGFKNVLNCEFSQLWKINIYYFATAGSTTMSPYQLSGKYSIEDDVKQVM